MENRYQCQCPYSAEDHEMDKCQNTDVKLYRREGVISLWLCSNCVLVGDEEVVNFEN